MKKLMLFTILAILFINSKAQDTTCTMVRPHEVLEFQYSPTKLIDRYNNEGYVYLEIKEGQVLALHLYDKQVGFRKVFLYFPCKEGETQKVEVNTLNSENNTYYIKGPIELAILTQTPSD